MVFIFNDLCAVKNRRFTENSHPALRILNSNLFIQNQSRFNLNGRVFVRLTYYTGLKSDWRTTHLAIVLTRACAFVNRFVGEKWQRIRRRDPRNSAFQTRKFNRPISKHLDQQFKED